MILKTYKWNYFQSPIIDFFFVSCRVPVPRSPGMWNWILLVLLPFIFIFGQCVNFLLQEKGRKQSYQLWISVLGRKRILWWPCQHSRMWFWSWRLLSKRCKGHQLETILQILWMQTRAINNKLNGADSFLISYHNTYLLIDYCITKDKTNKFEMFNEILVAAWKLQKQNWSHCA